MTRAMVLPACRQTTDRQRQPATITVAAAALHQVYPVHFLRRLLRRMATTEEDYTGDDTNPSVVEASTTEEILATGSPVLPDSLLLEIFSRLDPQDLGRASCVSRQWYRVAGDELLWREMIRRDCSKWESLSHEANPELFEATADLANKERYLRCSPKFRQSLNRLPPEASTLSLTRLLPDLLRRAWPFYRKPLPKLAILGPGLDKGGVSLARKFVYDVEGQFDVGKGFPGSLGIGSGFVCTMRHDADSEGKTESVFGISFLYSATYAERQEPKNDRGPSSNKLFVSNSEGKDLSPQFKNLCQSLSGLIYVLSATSALSPDQEKNAAAELAALADHCWQISNGKPMPLIVLSILQKEQEESQRTVTCPDAIRLLNLNAVRLPWRVYNARAEDAVGMIEGIQWMLDVIHER